MVCRRRLQLIPEKVTKNEQIEKADHPGESLVHQDANLHHRILHLIED